MNPCNRKWLKEKNRLSQLLAGQGGIVGPGHTCQGVYVPHPVFWTETESAQTVLGDPFHIQNHLPSQSMQGPVQHIEAGMVLYVQQPSYLAIILL